MRLPLPRAIRLTSRINADDISAIVWRDLQIVLEAAKCGGDYYLIIFLPPVLQSLAFACGSRSMITALIPLSAAHTQRPNNCRYPCPAFLSYNGTTNMG